MEKIASKIEDVIIERSVPNPKGSLESPYGNTIQQPNYQFPQSLNKRTTGNEADRLLEVGKSNSVTESNIYSNTFPKLVSQIPVSRISNENNSTTNVESKINNCLKDTANNSHGLPGGFASSKILMAQGVVNNLGIDFESHKLNATSLQMTESGVSLPKQKRIDSLCNQVINSERALPDLSRFSGISIERRRRSEVESHPVMPFGCDNEKMNQICNPSISIERILSKTSPKMHDKIDTVKIESSEGESFDEEERKVKTLKCESECESEVLSEDCKGKCSQNDDHHKSESDDCAPVEDEVVKIKNEIEEEEEVEEEEEEEEEEIDDIAKVEMEEIDKEAEISGVKEADIEELACTDLVELMQKGELEGEIEEVKDNEIIPESIDTKTSKRKLSDNDGSEKEKKRKRSKKKKKVKKKKEGEMEGKSEIEEKEENDLDEGKDDDDDNDDDEDDDDEDDDDVESEDEDEEKSGKKVDEKNIDKSKITNANLRKNIREVMDETKLDEATLAAQRQEAERLKRLQEQQRIIREVQRQIALNRQNQKAQSKVLSLLQGNSQTSILKTSSTSTQVQNSKFKAQNSVLVKLSNGEQTSLNNKKMIELLKNSKNKTILGKPQITKTLFKQGMVTPSVSIAPVSKKDPVVDDKKKKKGDVVTISSDSEDDCIVLSDEDESEPEEDPTNSGMHTNDKYNLPDEKGRVIVNVGHPESESDLYLAPQIAKVIKPHQIGGIRFLYDNVIESTERFSSSAGFGCILAHSMGLGKTLQIVSFSDIFLRYTSAKTILCIMPINTIQNWLAEFNMWLPKESSSEDVRCRDFDLFIVNESLKNINARAKVILDWQKSGGVLLMGYELFRLLSLKKSHKSKKKKKNFDEADVKYKEVFEELYSALVFPGPDLVICDEGHRIKNSHATTSQALKQIRTKRRIVLTGYPLQNNLLEYWCMVDFVRPNYLGTKTEFSNMFERPIQNGQCIDSTPQDKRLMRYRAHVLHSLLEGFVQRRSHAVLQSALPEKEEYVLLLRFTPFQRKLYDTFMNEVVRTVAVPNPLKAFAVCCKIWNHPDVLYNFLKRKGEGIDLDLEETLPPSLQIPQFPYREQSSGLDRSNLQGSLPWPRRGPGSRGGKVRQPAARRAGRGRKPAATISPSIAPMQETTKDQFAADQYSNNKNFQNQTNNLENFQDRNYNQNQYSFGSEYENQAGYSNPGYNKNPLNNLENMSSSNNFENKRFFSQSNETGNRGHYGNPPQNFESGRIETNFNRNNSNDSSLNSNFDSNLNSNSSNFNQSDRAKPFEYNQDYNSEYYSMNNYQNPNANSNYPRNNKPGVFPSNSPYFPSQSFRNSENYDYQANNNIHANFLPYERSNNSNYQPSVQNMAANNQTLSGSNQVSNFQNSNVRNNFQESNSGSNSNYSGSFQSSDITFEGSRFGQKSSSNYQENSANFEVNQNKNFTNQQTTSESNYQRCNYESGYWPQSNWNYTESPKTNSNFRTNATTNNDFLPQKFGSFDERQESKIESKNLGSGNNNSSVYTKVECDFSQTYEKKDEVNSKVAQSDLDENKSINNTKEEEEKKEEIKSTEFVKKEDSSLPYDWVGDLFKAYVTGVIENSSKMEVFFHIITESVKLNDRILVFSQSLLTLDLIEDYLHRQNVPNTEENWTKNKNYFRLDGSTPGLEREKLINEFNGNPNIYLFLVSTRAGSLGINLVGANRVIVFDASWNPCHDTQAVCRVYRYGQRKPCFVYRLVMDSCLEKKIYDRQVNKQGMADRVVDELNPDAHLSIKEVTNLCWDDQEDTAVKDYSHLKDKYSDEIIRILLERCSKVLSKEPFKHESLLIDRKEKKLSQAEKRLAKRSYELEKQAANQPKNIYSFFPNAGQRNFVKPIASVRPMQSDMNMRISSQIQNRSKWIPAEVWQKQGMSAQEMTLPLDVVIPTSSPEKTSIVLKAGQRVMVLKSPKGIYMQLENGKIIAIRSAFKVGQNGPGGTGKHEELKKEGSTSVQTPLKPNISVTPKISQVGRPGMIKQPFVKPFTKVVDKKVPVNMNAIRSRQIMGKAKPFVSNKNFENSAPETQQKLVSGEGSFNYPEKTLGSSKLMVNEDEITVKDKSKALVENAQFCQEKLLNNLNEKTEQKLENKSEMSDSLETLRKVTEKISDVTPREEIETDIKYQQVNPLKSFQNNFTSQVKENPPSGDEIKKDNIEVESVKKEEKAGKGNVTSSCQQTPNENIQNWLMNQSYPPVDPYGNYFPGYYAYGPGPNPMIPHYDGFYPPSSYSHSAGRNSSLNSQSSQNSQLQQQQQQQQPAPLPQSQSQSQPLQQQQQQHLDNSKSSSQSSQAPINSIASNIQTSSTSRNSPVVNTPIYPPYPNPYPYHYNYPKTPSFSGQGFSFSNQNQATPQHASQQSQNVNVNITSGQNQIHPYDNSMYSAFHRPEAPFQNSENPYSASYPRPPYPNSGTPGFFPYNTTYPNYPYAPNFNPYMHPASYGYSMQSNSPASGQGANSHGSNSGVPNNGGSAINSGNSS